MPANGTVAVLEPDAVGDDDSAAISILLLDEEGVDEVEVRACEGDMPLVEAGLVSKEGAVAVAAPLLDLDGGASRDFVLP